MFTFLVTQSLRNRLLVLALSARAGGVRRVQPSLRLPVDVLPGPQPADRHHHDRGRRARAARGRAAGQLPDRDADERRAGRHPRALGLRRRPVDRLCRVRLGHRHLSATASWSPSGSALVRDAAAAERHAADGPDQLDHGPDPADRADQRPRHADGAARGRRLHHPAAAAQHPRRRAGDPDGRRGAAVPRRAAARRRCARSASPTSRSRRRWRSSAPTPAAASPTCIRANT